MAKVIINLDGKTVEASAGATILETAQAQGINIPTLCHDPRLKPTAACRLCMVEVEKMRNPMPACDTLVSEGIVVKTGSPAIRESRRIALELLLSDHYGDCVSPCQSACPAGIDIQGQLAYIANGQFLEALKLIKESNPLPLVCGRVCPRFCEKECRRSLVDEPVAINMLKRFVADYEVKNGAVSTLPVKNATGKKVAIVGGGPAGLTAAYYMALQGHAISLFESSPQLGGMLRYGIPEYRLPKEILDKEIVSITRLCREVKCGVELGRDFSLDQLRNEGFQAIFLALGAQLDQKMKIPGEDASGVYSGIGFLRDVIEGRRVELGRRVIVVGGGNTAIDAARTALRLGVREVTIVYRRSRAEMPANHEEVEGAEQEGVHFQFLTNPVKVVSENGRISGLECVRMALGAPDSSGRRRPEVVKGSEFTLEADACIMALGQSINTGKLGSDYGLSINTRGGLAVNAETLQTSLPDVFAGGDCTEGPATAVEAIGAGRRAAEYIHRLLSDQAVTPQIKSYNCSKGELNTIDKNQFTDVPKVPRAIMPAVKPEIRKHNFSEIETGLKSEEARLEAGRCLSCGCQDVFECRLRELATEYKVDDKAFSGLRRFLPILTAEHPYILRDRNKCILCGRCVRICSEVEGASALGYAHRGFTTTVEPALSMPLSETSCDSCGLCISTCPTGAITARLPLPKPGPLRLEIVSSTCSRCGIGCNLDLHVNGGNVVEVTSRLESPVNHGNMCRLGSFEISHPAKTERLTYPVINEFGKLRKSEWKDAMSLAARGLRQVKDRYGAQSIAVLVSPQLTNEDAYLAQKIARLALGTNNISSLQPLVMNDSLTLSLGKNASTCSYADLRRSDFILVFNCDLMRDYPVVGLQVREAITKGSRMVIMNSNQTTLDHLAGAILKISRRNSFDALKSVLQYLVSYDILDHQYITEHTTGFNNLQKYVKEMPVESISRIPRINPSRLIEVITQYVRAKRPVIIVDGDTIAPSDLSLLNSIALAAGNIGRPGAGILKLHTAANSQGMLDMGISHQYLPGYKSMKPSTLKQTTRDWGANVPPEPGMNALEILTGIQQGEIKGLLVVGHEALGEAARRIFTFPYFSVLIDTEMPHFRPDPQVILPGAAWLESAGTTTNCERRIQPVNPVANPPGGYANWQILSLLAAEMGVAQNYKSAADITAEIGTLVPEYAAGLAGGQFGLWPFTQDGKFSITGGRAVFNLPNTDSPDYAEQFISLADSD
ncbi:MAG TPA: NAD(P)-binding protein [Dehalococcoidales bacterium]|nr:NAD(P)-binding protein [Dehalococcoidales bacterium]